MKYLSEVTGKTYESAEACETAEAQFVAEQKAAQKAAEEKAIARKERAAEVNEAFKAAEEAKNHYIELRNKFVEDYGSYHFTYNTKEPVQSFSAILSDLFKMF